MSNLTNLEELYLHGNELDKPAGCPTDYYDSKEKVAAFLHCLA